MHKITPVLSGRWRTFLQEVDAHLPAPVELHCFGGFTLAVCYGLPRPTGDVEYITATPQAGAASVEALAGKESELAKKHRLHLQRVTIADVPQDYDQRLVRIFAQDLTTLRLLAFEVHDIVLSQSSLGTTRRTWRMPSFWPRQGGWTLTLFVSGIEKSCGRIWPMNVATTSLCNYGLRPALDASNCALRPASRKRHPR
jgi:hypothetical protein